jgi:hypothetical protein
VKHHSYIGDQYWKLCIGIGKFCFNNLLIEIFILIFEAF